MPDSPTVTLYPAPLEYSLHREQYDALMTDLEAEGFLVQVEPPIEERGGGTWNIAPEFYDLVIQVGGFSGAVLSIAALVAMVRAQLEVAKGQTPSGTAEARSISLVAMSTSSPTATSSSAKPHNPD